MYSIGALINQLNNQSLNKNILKILTNIPQCMTFLRSVRTSILINKSYHTYLKRKSHLKYNLCYSCGNQSLQKNKQMCLELIALPLSLIPQSTKATSSYQLVLTVKEYKGCNLTYVFPYIWWLLCIDFYKSWGDSNTAEIKGQYQ